MYGEISSSFRNVLIDHNNVKAHSCCTLSDGKPTNNNEGLPCSGHFPRIAVNHYRNNGKQRGVKESQKHHKKVKKKRRPNHTAVRMTASIFYFFCSVKHGNFTSTEIIKTQKKHTANRECGRFFFAKQENRAV